MKTLPEMVYLGNLVFNINVMKKGMVIVHIWSYYEKSPYKIENKCDWLQRKVLFYQFLGFIIITFVYFKYKVLNVGVSPIREWYDFL